MRRAVVWTPLQFNVAHLLPRRAQHIPLPGVPGRAKRVLLPEGRAAAHRDQDAADGERGEKCAKVKKDEENANRMKRKKNLHIPLPLASEPNSASECRCRDAPTHTLIKKTVSSSWAAMHPHVLLFICAVT